nr:hypothetical protein CFP56_05604 [Quercus suber]
MPAGVSGVAALVGGCGRFGAPTGTDSGGLAGDETGVGRLTGDGIGEDPFADGLGVGETDSAGGFAGDLAGETEGDFAGGVDNGGEIAGVDVGGDKAGDFEGDAGEIVGVDVGGDKAGDVVGEVAGECEGLVGEVDGEAITARPLKITRTLFFESEPDSSLTGPGAASGEEIAGAVLGVLLFGTTTGASAGVAELDGMPAGVSGVAALVGGCGRFGAPTGTDSGGLAGDETGVGRLTGDGIGEDPFADGLGVGETDSAGGFAGDLAGETEGDFAGGVDNGGEIAGVDVGGDKAGDFEGDAGEIVGVDVGGDKAGDVVGEVAGECEGLVGEVDGEVNLYSSMYIYYFVLSVSTGSQFSVPTSASFFISLARKFCDVLIAEAVALIAASTVHQVCITTCFLFSVGLVYELNKLSGMILLKSDSKTKRF